MERLVYVYMLAKYTLQVLIFYKALEILLMLRQSAEDE